jgi:hypothetical protein
MTIVDTADHTRLTITLHPNQAAALNELHAKYPLVERDQLLRLVLNVGLKALANDGEAMMCLEAGNTLAAERAN